MGTKFDKECLEAKVECLKVLDSAFVDLCDELSEVNRTDHPLLSLDDVLKEWKKLNNDFFRQKIGELREEIESL